MDYIQKYMYFSEKYTLAENDHEIGFGKMAVTNIVVTQVCTEDMDL